ncbi:DUF3124 domain-containing protein [Joostella sp.]|uniref:DUF3124 domain-containing protein n=1 Tax=Joostella sp. TaxID=2231138 RepID=UPI003A9132E3
MSNKYIIKYTLVVFSIFLMISCETNTEGTDETIQMVDWSERTASIPAKDSLINGQTYLSIYSQIYSYTLHGKHDLTTTVSIRNTSDKDTIYIKKADYYDHKGELIRSYMKSPVYMAPLETLEIVIAKDDNHGGSGANFIFDWAAPKDSSIPHFEGIMISTAGQQGLSFSTQGVRTK